MSLQRGLVAFAAAVFVFQHVPAYSGDFGTWIDLATPFAVLGAAAVALWDAAPVARIVGLVGGILFADGHGIHLAANDIRHERLAGEAARVAHFWDERFGHIEWHLGLLALLAAFCLADGRVGRLRRDDVLVAALLGWTLFTNTVEGGDWGLTLVAAPLFLVGMLRRPRRATATCAAATLLAAALIGVWAAWQGGVPQFSEVGWL